MRVAQMSVVIGVGLSLTGCANFTSSDKPYAPPPSARTCHQNIDVTGRFSLFYAQGEETQSVHGHFQWNQTTEHTQLLLRSPLGQTMVKVDVTPNWSRLTMSDHQVRIAADPDRLIKESTGLPIPVSDMRSWLQACSKGRGMDFSLGNEIVQNGWRLRYPVWDNQGTENVRPKKIEMNYETNAEEVSLRLLINTWQPR